MNIPIYLKNIPWLIKRLIAIIATLVFLELFYSAPILIGENGIVVSNKVIEYKNSTQAIWSNFIEFPMLFWLGTSNFKLQTISLIGFVLSLVVAVGVDWIILDICIWFIYASFLQVLALFVDINDFILIECLFLMIFLFPIKIKPIISAHVNASQLGIVGIFIFLFKLSFGMLLYKIMYKFPGWYDFTLLKNFCSNSPTPTPISFFAYQMPMHYHQFFTCSVILFQILISILIFTPFKYRKWAVLITMILQIPIMLITNLGATNILTIVMSLALLVDFSKLNKLKAKYSILYLPLFLYCFVSITALRTHFNPPESNHLSKKFLNYKKLDEASFIEKIEIISFRYKISNILARFHGIFDDQRDVEFQYSKDGINFESVYLKNSLGTEYTAPKFFWGSSVVRTRYPYFYYLKNSHLPIWRGGIYDSFNWHENLIRKSILFQEDFFNNYTETQPSCFPDCKYYKFIINKYEYTNFEIWERESRWWAKNIIKETPVIKIDEFNGKLSGYFYPDR